ncbi:TPA: hypothetical protein H1012_03390, partial [archaeon]|nr:hypothetical protein [Candidatus Naiadarchaeales archaeon SRR2090159.bin1288]
KCADVHSEAKTKGDVVEKEVDVAGLPKTEPVYYTDTKLTECKSKIIKIIGNYVVLDKTVFYPTGGGQQHDNGTLGSAKVVDVVKVKGIILHEVESTAGLKVGQIVEGKIDAGRRKRLARNHDSAHMLVGASRAILGKHIWQAGSHIEPEKGRLDITHYQNLTEAEKLEIEKLANKIISEKRKITKTLMPRNEAEEKYGFLLYQGGAVPGKHLRVVNIENFDTEACGGTHNTNTSEIEQIKILKTEKIQDGVIRLVFVAGKDLIVTKELDEKGLLENTLNVLAKFGVKGKTADIGELGAASQVFKVKLEDLPKTFERFFSEMKDNRERIEDLEKSLGQKPEGGEALLVKELNSAQDLSVVARVVFEHWKGQGKRIEQMESQLAAKRADILLATAKKIGSADVVITEEGSFELAIKIANAIIGKNKEALAIISSVDKSLAAAGEKCKIDCVKVLQSLVVDAKVNGNAKRAIGIGEIKLNEKEIIEKIKAYSR